ncbi:hypothetical protein Syun_000579 [Stephania yunnanensis]|uniref:Cytochrome P450 n=1 Tax=Stephania yunnanensis TaxID=152371 RepID=A0AAP0LHT3_9MAGN
MQHIMVSHQTLFEVQRPTREPSKSKDASNWLTSNKHTSIRTIEWGGHDGTSSKEVRAEVDRVVGSSMKVGGKDIEEFQYLQAVVKETLRLHTPLPFLRPQMAVEDTKFMGRCIEVQTGEVPCSSKGRNIDYDMGSINTSSLI